MDQPSTLAERRAAALERLRSTGPISLAVRFDLAPPSVSKPRPRYTYDAALEARLSCLPPLRSPEHAETQ